MKDDWISVADKLPKPRVLVLTYSPELRGSPYRVLETNNGRFFSDVKYWKPLYPPLVKAKRGFKEIHSNQ